MNHFKNSLKNCLENLFHIQILSYHHKNSTIVTGEKFKKIINHLIRTRSPERLMYYFVTFY